MRTLTEFNRDFEYRGFKRIFSGEEKKSSPVKSAIFYFALIALVIIAFVYSGSGDVGKRFGPFAFHSILTDSMESVYPVGTLIFSWQVKPEETLNAGLANGDDIVFTAQDGRVYAHRIIEIMNDFEDSGQRGFRTQGVNSPNPDSFVTFEGNVIGKIFFSIPYLGGILGIIAENIYFVLGVVGVVFVIAVLLRRAFAPEKKIAQEENIA